MRCWNAWVHGCSKRSWVLRLLWQGDSCLQPWWRDSRLQLWGFTSLMLVLLFVGSCLASFCNGGSLRKTHSCFVEWWHLIENREEPIVFSHLFWQTNSSVLEKIFPNYFGAATIPPFSSVFFWMELLLQWPTKNRSSPCKVTNMFPGFFLSKKPQKTTLP